MQTPEAVEPRPSPRPAPRRIGPFTVVRLLLVVGWVVVAVAAVAQGERTVSYAALQHQLADGDVDHVVVTRGLGAHQHGYGPQQIRWRRGPLMFRTQVVERSTGMAGRAAARSVRHHAVVSGDVGVDLVRQHPGLVVTRGPYRIPGDEFKGWALPSWTALTGFVLYLLTIGLLVSDGEPRWATRWAWFWQLALVPLVGVPAFLVLGTPGPLRDPAARERRVTGLPALFLAWLLLPGLGALIVGLV